jgi:putative restriction endonuclease
MFVDRALLASAGVHLPRQAGISGGEKEGADSIVVSGGYEDDEDYGDYIIYTGHGGQQSGVQAADQEWERGNLALRVSEKEGLPVRVVRGAGGEPDYSPAGGYRYDGLFFVEQSWREPGKSGFQVCRFRLRSLEQLTIPQSGEEPGGQESPPSRVLTSLQRIVRSTAMSRQVKEMHQHRCQVCGEALVVGSGPYAEGAHIRPLGTPHNGPDSASNILCLCPNDHVRFDLGAIVITDSLQILDVATAMTIGKLRTVVRHEIDRHHLAYRRERFGSFA